MRFLPLFLPLFLVATILQGRMPVSCGPMPQACIVVAESGSTMCCQVAPACLMQCMRNEAPASDERGSDLPCPPGLECRLCCMLCEPGVLAMKLPELGLTSAELWPGADPSYPILEAPLRWRLDEPPLRDPPDATARRALLCCWLT